MTIHIQELTFDTIIGILEFERTSPQKVVLDIEIEYNYNQKKFIDYSKVAQDIQNDMQTKKYLLIEDALDGLKELLKANYPSIQTLQIKLFKPDILPNCTVGLSNFWIF